jgi:hypothetical protein
MLKLVLLLSLCSSLAWADDITDLLNKLDGANDKCSANGKLSCQKEKAPVETEVVIPTQPEKPKYPRKKVIAISGQEIEISVIPEDKIKSIQDIYSRINLRVMDDDVCSQRAHVVGDILAQNNIETAKLFVEPESGFFTHYIIPDEKARNLRGTTPQWPYHVANLIYVQKKNGDIVEYIIDSFMESHYPIPRDQWEKRLRTNPDSSIATMDIGSRYALDPSQKSWVFDEAEGYNKKQLDRAKAIMRGEPKIVDTPEP